MKTIFRSTIAAFMFAAIIALGAVAGFAQDPCADADGQTALGDKFRALYSKKDVQGRKDAIDTGKQFLEKYGSCESTKDLSDYLKVQLPKMEVNLKAAIDKIAKDALVARFNTGLTAKNWDDVYASGKELLGKYPDEFRVGELVLGSIGLDETAKSPRVTKWNDDTLRFAKQSIQDLESGKLTSFGIGAFTYKSKSDAIGWMNYTIGYILMFDKNDKKNAVSYLYKASQVDSDTKSNSVVYQSIGSYYFDDAKALIGEIPALVEQQKALQASVNATDTPEVKQQKLDAIKAKSDAVKAKVGILNGTVERALDAYSRAYAFAPDTPAGKTYQASIRTTLTQLYNVRFDKPDGLDAWIKAAPARPFPDPTSAITPIIDPEPATGAAVPSTPVAAPIKPSTSSVPASKPAANSKPQSGAGVTANANGAATATTAKPAAKPVVKKKGTR